MEKMYAMLFNLSSTFLSRLINLRDYFSNRDFHLGSKASALNYDNEQDREVFYSLLNGSIGSVDNFKL